MKKTSLETKLFQLGTLATVLSLPQLAVASFKSVINQGLTDYLVPTIMVVVIFGASVGLARNFKAIFSDHERKEGLMNAAWIMLYVIIIIAAVIGTVAIVANLTGNVQI